MKEKNMASKQSMTQTIIETGIKVAKTGVIAARETENPVDNTRTAQQTPGVS